MKNKILAGLTIVLGIIVIFQSMYIMKIQRRRFNVKFYHPQLAMPQQNREWDPFEQLRREQIKMQRQIDALTQMNDIGIQPSPQVNPPQQSSIVVRRQSMFQPAMNLSDTAKIIWLWLSFRE